MMKLSEQMQALAQKIPEAGALRQRIEERIKTRKTAEITGTLTKVLASIELAEKDEKLSTTCIMPATVVESISVLLDSRNYVCTVARPNDRELERVMTIVWIDAPLPPTEATPRPFAERG